MMFMTGEWLQQRLAALNKRVLEATNGSVHLEEYIALPAYGQIIARFQTDSVSSLTEVDEWERQIQGLAGEEFLVDFMGSVYRQLGVEYSRLDEINERLGQRFKEEPIQQGPYAEQIEKDAQTLLLQCGFSDTVPVWEIQWENDEYYLLLLGEKSRAIRSIACQPPIHVSEVNKARCDGLMRAAFAARRLGVSLGRLMLEAMEG